MVQYRTLMVFLMGVAGLVNAGQTATNQNQHSTLSTPQLYPSTRIQHSAASQTGVQPSFTNQAISNVISQLHTDSLHTITDSVHTDTHTINLVHTPTGYVGSTTTSTTYSHVSPTYTHSTQQLSIQPTASSSTLSTQWPGNGGLPPSNRSQQNQGPTPVKLTSPKCAQTGGCCSRAMSQFPAYVEFEENQPTGTVLVPLFGVSQLSFSMKVVSPPELTGQLEEYFNISQAGASSYMFQVVKHIDIEELYLKANRNTRVTHFEVMIECFDAINRNTTVGPRTMNITIIDVDDTGPVFQDITGHEHCVVPVYTADTEESFLGKLQISPTQIRAVDGDLTQSNNISYTVMHGEPNDYDIYFELNFTDGTVTKTKKMNSTNPNKYVLFVETYSGTNAVKIDKRDGLGAEPVVKLNAVEDSPDQQNRVAILSIKVVQNVVITQDPHTVSPALKLSLEVVSVVVLAGFISCFTILVWHRKRVKERRVVTDNEFGDYIVPPLAVYHSSCSSLSSVPPTIASPSAIIVTPVNPGPSSSPYAEVRNKRNKKFITREKSPIDTALRPAWNAPKPKSPVRYTFGKKLK